MTVNFVPGQTWDPGTPPWIYLLIAYTVFLFIWIVGVVAA